MFEVEEADVSLCQTIKGMIEDDCASDEIPIPNVTGSILAKVIEFNKKNGNAGEEEEMKKWNAEFVNIEQNVLFDLILAANYLNNKKLLDLTCQTVADRIKDKSPEEVREIFHITNDFTPEEEAEVRKENAWAFD